MPTIRTADDVMLRTQSNRRYVTFTITTSNDPALRPVVVEVQARTDNLETAYKNHVRMVQTCTRSSVVTVDYAARAILRDSGDPNYRPSPTVATGQRWTAMEQGRY